MTIFPISIRSNDMRITAHGYVAIDSDTGTSMRTMPPVTITDADALLADQVRLTERQRKFARRRLIADMIDLRRVHGNGSV